MKIQKKKICFSTLHIDQPIADYINKKLPKLDDFEMLLFWEYKVQNQWVNNWVLAIGFNFSRHFHIFKTYNWKENSENNKKQQKDGGKCILLLMIFG